VNDTDIEAFNAAWGGAWDAYGRNQTAAGIKLAFRCLADLPLAAVAAALAAHLNAEAREPPTIAAIRQRISGDDNTRVQRAWALLRRAIARVGPYRSVAFDDPAIHCVVRDMGGWAEVCDWRTADLPFHQQRFEKAYRAYLKRGAAPHPAYLRGIAETHNAAEGYATDGPTLIGDRPAAETVIARGGNERIIHRPANDRRALVEHSTNVRRTLVERSSNPARQARP
jgi:hypothetical protein